MKTTAKHFALVLTCCLLRDQTCYAEHGGPMHAFFENGEIFVVTEAPLVTLGLSISSPAGNLVPRDPAVGAPYAFLLLNTPNEVTVGALPPGVTVDGALDTGVGFSGPATAPLLPSVSVTYGTITGAVSAAFPVTVIPEPASGLLAVFGVLGLLGFRRRR